jgi:4-hydroxybutyryl-CoA dehydratase/vinylacetyl-CoA-Delta-isomerase
LTREIYLFGERIESVVDNPIIAPSANSLGMTYEVAEKASGLAIVKSHLTRKKINRFTHITVTKEDVVKKLKLLRFIADRVGCCFQRCGGTDLLNVLYHVTYETDKKHGTNYHDRFRKYLIYVQNEDLAVSAGIMDVKGDRSKRPSQQADPDLYTRIVERRKDGIVVRGAKASQTGGCNMHELLNIPCRNLIEGEEDWAVSFVVPVNAKGVYQIVGRRSCDTRAAENSEIDIGNPNYSSVETLIIFDDVFVPNERIFLCGEYDMAGLGARMFGGLHRHTSGGSCIPGRLDVGVGAAALIAEYNGIADKPHIKDKIAEMVSMVETIGACALASAHESRQLPSGLYINNPLLGNVTKYNKYKLMMEIVKLMNDPAGGLVLTLPSEKDFRHPKMGKYMEKYLKAAPEIPTEHRMRILKLIESMSVGVNNQLSAVYGAGSAKTQLDSIYQLCNLEYKKKIAKRIAGIEKREVESEVYMFGERVT